MSNHNDKDGRQKRDRVEWNQIQWVMNNLTDEDLKVVGSKKVTLKELCDFIDEAIDGGGEFKYGWEIILLAHL